MHLYFRVPLKISVTLSEHCISHSARFKNTMIDLLKTSTDPQIPKGVDALKQLLFLKKRRIQFPLDVPASKNACALNPRSWPGWNRHLVNSAAPRGQHVVLNPRIGRVKSPLSPAMPRGSKGRGFNWLMDNRIRTFPPFCLNFVFAR